MHDMDMHEVSDEFAACWQAAGRHLQSQTHDGQLSWLKANLNPPFLEHLSFRMGNQLFYVRIDDVDGDVQGPGNPNGFRTIADIVIAPIALIGDLFPSRHQHRHLPKSKRPAETSGPLPYPRKRRSFNASLC